MWDGKKSTARSVVYDMLEVLKEKTGNENPLEVFDTAIKNVAPQVEVRSRRVGGANYQVPYEIRPDRRTFLAMNWIIETARKRKGKPMHLKLSDEILAAVKGEGEAMKKRENTHKMAEANKAFAHMAW
jgi:small subunit ribosomal protein S7